MIPVILTGLLAYFQKKIDDASDTSATSRLPYPVIDVSAETTLNGYRNVVGMPFFYYTITRPDDLSKIGQSSRVGVQSGAIRYDANYSTRVIAQSLQRKF